LDWSATVPVAVYFFGSAVARTLALQSRSYCCWYIASSIDSDHSYHGILTRAVQI
jgi:hypothetical protein